MKRIKKNLFIYFTVFLLVGAFFYATNDGLAWFDHGTKSNDNIITTHEGYELSWYQASYNSTDDTYAWEQCDPEIPDASPFNNLNLGNIDNVGELQKDNTAYFRLMIPANAGNEIEFSLSYNQNDTRYNLYYYPNNDTSQNLILCTTQSQIGLRTGAEILTGLSDIESNTLNAKCFIEYSYAISGSADISEVVFNETTNDVFEPDMFTANPVNYGDVWYLYIKITPNLEALTEAVNFIDVCMPCVLTFNLEATFEVKKI